MRNHIEILSDIIVILLYPYISATTSLFFEKDKVVINMKKMCRKIIGKGLLNDF